MGRALPEGFNFPWMSVPTAFFDYDGTLIEGDSILYWQRFYYARRPWMRVFQLANAVGLLLHGARLVSSHTLKRLFLWPLSFERPESLDALGRAFVREDLSRRWHRPVLARLRAHHRLGHRVVVISASGTFYLRHLAELLPEGCTVLGTEMVWKGGVLRFPGYGDGNLRGANKIRRLRALGFAAAGAGGYAYSDHHHDIPLLEFVDHAHVIRPTAKMTARAAEGGWPVWEWPRTRARGKLRVEAACLLLFAWAPRVLAAVPEGEPTDAEVEEQMKAVGGQ